MYLEAAGNIRLEKEKCLNRLYRGIECRTCVEQCPAKALSLEGGKLQADTEACVGCGQCLTHCPTGVFHMEKWDEKTLVKQALESESETVVLFCSGHPLPYRKSKTPSYECLQIPLCLAGLSKAALFEIAAGKKLELMLDACGECEHKSCLPLIKNQAERTCEMLCACRGEGNLFQVETRPDGEKGRKRKAVPSGEKACSRREFLFRLADVGLKTISSEYEAAAVEADRKAASASSAAPIINGVRIGRKLSYRPSWMERLKTVYHQTYQATETHGEAAAWPSVRIRRNCTNCNLCASFCPTGALRIEVEEKHGEDTGVTMSAAHYFQPMLCADCRLCAAVCPIEAIVRDRVPNQRPFVTQIIFRGQVVPCRKCGALTYNVSAGYCHWCKTNNYIDDIKQAVRSKLCKRQR